MKLWINEVFRADKPLIGVVHVGPLPGSPIYNGGFEDVVEKAVRAAGVLEDGGVDGVIIENYNDKLYPKDHADPATIVSLAVIVREVKSRLSIPIGVNVLRNCCLEALAIAYVLNCSFIRVNVYSETVASDQGIIEASAYKLQRYRRYLGAWSVRVMADVHVKHASPIGFLSIEDVARDAVERGCADAVIVTGSRTGVAPDQSLLSRVKACVKAPVVVGSGLNPENARVLMRVADAAIVGSYFKAGGEMPVKERVEKLARVFRELRRSV